MIIQIYDDDLLNGEGIREVIYLQGCPHHCNGCFNPETWEQKEETTETIARTENFVQHLTNKLNQPYIDGITITGGDPLAHYNLEECDYLCTLAKTYNKTVWVYTGYTWENVKDLPFINNIDVLCDGTFIKSLKSPNKPWIGSSNQRVIDVQKSLINNNITIYNTKY